MRKRENEGDEKWKREREREKVEGYADEEGCVVVNSQTDEAESQAQQRWLSRGCAPEKDGEGGNGRVRSTRSLALSLSLSRAGRKAKRNDRDSHGGESGAFTLRTAAFFPSSALSSNPNPRHRDAMVVGTATSPASVILVSPRQCSSRLPHSGPFNWFFSYHPRRIDGDSFTPRCTALPSSKRRSV